MAVDGSTSLEILRYTQDDIEPTMARRSFVTLSMTLLVSLPSPLNHGVTVSQSHIVTRGGGSVISVTKCDKVLLTTPRLIRDC